MMPSYILDSFNRKIAKSIVLAQIGSDAGKYKYNSDLIAVYSGNLACGNSEVKRAIELGYTQKDYCIRSALNLIASYPGKSIFRFYVCEDVQRISKYLVYFDVKIEGARMQISFHSFDDSLKRYLNGSKASKVRWDRRSSAETAIAISKLLRATR